MDMSWMPVQGRHQVEIGASLGRALRARRGASNPPKRGGIPDRNFHCCRYNFKPESIDLTRPGTIEVKKGSVTVERGSTLSGESHLFQGSEQPAKELECVLIYDEELGRFTLEKLDSLVTLHYDRRVTASAGASYSSPAASTPSTSKEPPPPLDLEDEIERELLGTADAEGEADPEDDLEQALSAAVAASDSKPSKKPPPKEEEEEEEEGEIPLSALLADPPQKPSQPASKPPAAAARAMVPTSKPSAPSPASHPYLPPKLKPAVTPKSAATGKSKGKREHPLDPLPASQDEDVEEEVLEFGRPARPTKRAKASPPASLPLKSASVPIVSLALPSSNSAVSLPPAPTPPVPAKVTPVYSDSEEEWDEVAAPAPAPAATLPSPPVEPEVDDFEAALFGDELDTVKDDKEDDIDFLAAELEADSGGGAGGSAAKAPMSLNQFAGGMSLDDDDYSSTDESDDD
ncbi:hypothetical protein NEOLEDRAFT_1131584 [Neolentinus lepideus HHB14362 ss-1]|uniref:Transcription elongation factor Eaf N-terminal domain-containing protein n=1 Tax=Neolentinus lepideus HHB14362 ss-1 TaxID=1314782 RepID=A0A165TR96_9AGAM|nr:hypothetical protein NEOLEDRAFT_1131584 [Neolentinus lepideus HHB14362 ss-1]